MAGVTQFAYMVIGASDLNAWESFASDILGLQVSEREADGTLHLRMDEYYHRFIVRQSSKDDVLTYGWEVKSAEALSEIADRAARAGFKIEPASSEEARARKVVDLVKLRDPDEIEIELFYGPLTLPDDRFRSPRPISGFVADSMGLGHTVTIVHDPKASARFYCDILGMRVSDYVATRGHTLTFLHCNPRHHSLALADFPIPKRIHHIMMQVRELDDVGTTYELCERRGVERTTSIGRHTNDKMVSFYMKSPSGFAIEYGWGAREVDDSSWEVRAYQSPSIWGHRRL